MIIVLYFLGNEFLIRKQADNFVSLCASVNLFHDIGSGRTRNIAENVMFGEEQSLIWILDQAGLFSFYLYT
jgi:hypothetical protein